MVDHDLPNELPDWWDCPAQCAHGHPWGPGKVVVSWMNCYCTSNEPGSGHLVFTCRAEGCSSRRYRPRHYRPQPENDDDIDLTVCWYDDRHRKEGVPATRILDYGPDRFTPACDECAELYFRQGPDAADRQ